MVQKLLCGLVLSYSLLLHGCAAYTPLMDAIAANEEERMDLIHAELDAGADVNEMGDEITPLMVVSRDADGNLEIAELLIDRGADVNQVGYDGMTVLMVASDNGHTEYVQFLIDHEAEVNAQDFEGLTALIHASNAVELEAMKVLIAAGADVEIKDYAGKTALLHLAAPSGLGEMATDLIYSIFGPILDLFATVAEEVADVDAGIIRLSEYEKSAEILLDAGANIEARDEYEEKTPLLFAASSGRDKVAWLLIQKGADLDARDFKTFTPLLYTSDNKDIGLTVALVLAGADINAFDVIPEDEEQREKIENMKSFLDSNKTNRTALYHWMKNANYPMVKFLVEHGADPEIKSGLPNKDGTISYTSLISEAELTVVATTAALAYAIKNPVKNDTIQKAKVEGLQNDIQNLGEIIKYLKRNPRVGRKVPPNSIVPVEFLNRETAKIREEYDKLVGKK